MAAAAAKIGFLSFACDQHFFRYHNSKFENLAAAAAKCRIMSFASDHYLYDLQIQYCLDTQIQS